MLTQCVSFELCAMVSSLRQFDPFLCPMQPTWMTSSFLSLQILLLLYYIHCLSVSLHLSISSLHLHLVLHNLPISSSCFMPQDGGRGTITGLQKAFGGREEKE